MRLNDLQPLFLIVSLVVIQLCDKHEGGKATRCITVIRVLPWSLRKCILEVALSL